MTTSQTTCPDCKASTTHAETLTDLSGPRPIPITVHRCPDCGKVWQTTKQPTKPAKIGA